MYKSLQLPTEGVFGAYLVACDRTLGPLSSVNLFVGSNNSGKSRLIRELFKDLVTLPCTTPELSAVAIGEFAKDLRGKLQDNFSTAVTKIDGLSTTDLTKFCDPPSPFLPRESILPELRNLLERFCGLPGTLVEGQITNRDSRFPQILDAVRTTAKEGLQYFNERFWGHDIDFRTSSYIPILRGMRPLDDKHYDFYHERTAKDYFTATGPGANLGGQLRGGAISTGLDLYSALKSSLLGKRSERESVAAFEQFLGKNFFDGRRIALTPIENEKTVHISIEDDEELPMHHVGDGIQHLIVLTFPMFLNRERTCAFFIEEPDMGMHPGLQRTLLSVMLGFARNSGHQFFLTTHSNHFLDMTFEYDDIAVFLVRKTQQQKFEITTASDCDERALIELGVRSSSVFLTNATLWVEGITDRLYLRRLMAEYARLNPELARWREDTHYTFVEYQGSTLDHWTFDDDDSDGERIRARRLCSRSFLVADGDIATKADRREVYQKMLGDRFFILKGKEIENLLPEGVVRSVVVTKDSTLAAQSANILYAQYGHSPGGLGAYLDTTLGVTRFAAKSGTVKDKRTFCKLAIEAMDAGALVMSDDINELCQRLFEFIATQNQ